MKLNELDTYIEYTVEFKKLLKLMLSWEEADRPFFSDIIEYLNQYRLVKNEILDKYTLNSDYEKMSNLYQSQNESLDELDE